MKKMNFFAKVLSIIMIAILALPIHGNAISLTNIFSKIVFKHSPLQYIVPGKRISIELNLKQEAIKMARCYFKAKGKDFNFVEMALKEGSKDVYTTTLPAAAENTEAIEYVFMTVDEKGNVVKTQSYDVGVDAKQSVPSYQNVPSGGKVKVFSEIGNTVLEGFSDEIVMDIVESSLRYGFNAGFYNSAQIASAGGASGSAATATTTAVTAAAPLSTAVVVGGVAVAGAGAVAVAGGGGGGGGSSSSGSDLPGGTGEVKVTLQWSNCADLDLHVIDPCSNEIYFGYSSASCQSKTGTLDLDANAGSCSSSPAENIYWTTAPSGSYTVKVNYFSDKSGTVGSASYTVTTIVGSSRNTYTGTLSTQGSTDTVVSFTK